MPEKTRAVLAYTNNDSTIKSFNFSVTFKRDEPVSPFWLEKAMWKFFFSSSLVWIKYVIWEKWRGRSFLVG